ncbi:MAG: S41 family peptidase [Acidobacteria bacterium]|nr:S41 family peptidase [Acidobacteriota bacterium]
MRKLSRIGIAAALVLLAIAAAAYGPGMATSAGQMYSRLQVLEEIMEIIDRHYVDDVDVDELFDNATRGVLENLDPHSRYYSADEYTALQEQYRGDYAGIGVSFEMFDGVLTVLNALEGGPSQALGIRPGDQIIEVEKQSAIGWTVEEVYDRLRGPAGTLVNVTVMRPSVDELLQYTITRGNVEIPAVSIVAMLNDEVGYIRLATFSQKTADQVEKALQDLEVRGMKRLVLDLRGNGGGLMSQALQLADKFLEGGKVIVETRGRTAVANTSEQTTDRYTHPELPMIVLVNGGSASASEIVSGALQDWDRALIVGETTFGKALVQNQFRFRDGSALFLTIARYYTPSGRLIQREYMGDEYLGPEVVDDVRSEDDPEWTGDQTNDRPVYTTAGGRTVYGGGGIHPDIEIEPTRVSRIAWLMHRAPLRLFFRYGVRYAAGHAAEIPADFDDFNDNFVVTDEMVDDFVTFVRSDGIRGPLDENNVPLTDEVLDAARKYIRIYIKSDVAAAVWGGDTGREVLLRHDDQVMGTIDLLPQAANLLTLASRSQAG